MAENRGPSSRPSRRGSNDSNSSGNKRVTTLDKIQAMERQRAERRKEMDERKIEKKREEEKNQELGVLGDADFVKMIGEWRSNVQEPPLVHEPFDCGKRGGGKTKELCICVRKRPIGKREIAQNDHDAVSCSNPAVVVHDCKHRVDGITKFLNNSQFNFDHAFDECTSNDVIYDCVGRPLVEFVVNKCGRATVFAYGQTGSGKTFTMTALQERAAFDLFELLKGEHRVLVSFFEIYGGRCQDLLRNRARLQVREDGKGDVNVVGLAEEIVTNSDELLKAID